MHLRALKLRQFRNLAPTVLEPGDRFNVIYGDNGQGKTNLLEAIYAVCTLRSFRTAKLSAAIRVGEERSVIGARVVRDGLERIYELDIRKRGRYVRIDGKSVRPVARYFGGFNVVLFAPEDLQTPRASPAERRKFLDRAAFNLDTRYLPTAQDYQKVLRNRNALLRNMAERGGGDESLLAVYDEQLANVGGALMAMRARLVREISPLFCDAFGEIARIALPVTATYAPHELIAAVAEGESSEQFSAAIAEAVANRRKLDMLRGTTSVGPHRDDLVFHLAGESAATFASQGQLRAIMLAWKTAELKLIGEALGDHPVMLLDDVSSELDDQRNRYLFEYLARWTSQCFITTTHPRHVLSAEKRIQYRVEDGEITAENPT